MSTENIIELLRKVKELAERGVGGEKKAAQKMLDNLLKKHNMHFDDLEDTMKEREYHLPEADLNFWNQIKNFVIPEKRPVYKIRGKKNRYVVNLTDHEYLELDLMFEFYKDELIRQYESFYYAFLMKNNLLAKASENSKKPTAEEMRMLRLAMRLAEGIDTAEYQKRLQ